MKTGKPSLFLFGMGWLILLTACVSHDRDNSPSADLVELRGVVVKKPWTKSLESWNAGGSDYYVLRVQPGMVPDEKRTAKEGVILRPTEGVPLSYLETFAGQAVVCRGRFVEATVYRPPSDSSEQMPTPITLPVTGEVLPVTRGGGFEVTVLAPVVE